MQALNVLGGPLQACSFDPITGYTRTGCCETGPFDAGSHTVCVRLTADFLTYSISQGNDLSTPRPEYRFKGLNPGDRWCLCAARWLQAYEAGVAPPVLMVATHQKSLDIVPISALQMHALDVGDILE